MSIQQFRPASFNFLPVAIKNLLIINAILWLAENVFSNQLGFSFNQTFGLYYPESELFRPWQYVTHLFLHGNFLHLFSNMLALWMLGTVLENLWGSKRFLIYYFATGLGAAFIHTLSGWYEIQHLQNVVNNYAAAPNIMDFLSLVKNNMLYFQGDNLVTIREFISYWENRPDDPALAVQSIAFAQDLVTLKMNIPTVGASGAVFGVLLAFGMLFPNTVIYLYFALPIKAKYFVILYGLFELYSGFSNNPGDNVAHFAHLGGMLFGFILIKIWNKKNRRHFY